MEKALLKILFVDDEENIRTTIAKILPHFGFPRIVSIGGGRDAIDCLSSESFDLVITDLEMPDVRGDKVAAAARQADPEQAVFMISGFLTEEETQLLESLGVRKCIRKPFRVNDITGYVDEAFADLRKVLSQKADMEALNAMADTSWRDNGYQPEFQREALQRGLATGRRLGLSLRELWILEAAFLVRDLGMSRVERSIRYKPSGLKKDEKVHVRRHIEYSLEIARHMVHDPAVYSVVRGHHERPDGTGYPAGLRGNQINRLTLIISLLDTYAAVRSDRPYRRALNDGAVLRELESHRGTRWSNELVDAFLEE